MNDRGRKVLVRERLDEAGEPIDQCLWGRILHSNIF